MAAWDATEDRLLVRACVMHGSDSRNAGQTVCELLPDRTEPPEPRSCCDAGSLQPISRWSSAEFVRMRAVALSALTGVVPRRDDGRWNRTDRDLRAEAPSRREE